MKKSQNSNIQYLRAISVILVILFHIYPNYFFNGFLGVDVFFVISGFLITKILFDYKNKSFFFILINFYKKRFLRIYPALLFAIILTYILAKLFGPPIQSLRGEVISSILSYSNFYYIFSEVSYFETIFRNPLNHTWSLAVEIQFYLLYPFLFYFFLKKVSSNVNRIKKVLIFLIIFLFSISLFIEFYHPVFSFYSSFTRVWIFLFGALVFFNKFKYKSSLSLLGILLIIFVLIFNLNYYDQLKSLLVSAGIYFLILGVGDRDVLKKKLIIRRIFLSIGNSSYSIYLLHLPLLYYLDFYYDGFIKIILFLFFLIIFTSFSYNLIENKFRYLNFTTKKVVLVSLLIFIFSSTLNLNKESVAISLKKINFFERNYYFSKKINPDEIKLLKTPVIKKCKAYELNNQLGYLQQCVLSKKKDPKNVFFLHGNSFVLHFIPLFKNNTFVEKMYFIFSNNIFVEKNSSFLNDLSKKYQKFNYVLQINSLNDFKKLKTFIEKNKYMPNINIIIMGQIPYLEKEINPLKCLNLKIECKFSKDKDLEKKKNTDSDIFILRKKIKSISNSNSNIYFFDTYDKICPKNFCSTLKNDELIYFDHSHLTPQGALLLSKEFEIFLKGIN